ncbi:selenocysteine-specific translation elongation factor [Methylobacterium sp. sgz302541]|uniref:selenocysteine-specific translation elongation factor n=1 Tax=unclassified Methylobacterium TaxID=2615210 RepID=UPI003D34280A
MIVGTAGHIDHGKTALVRALTGVETDRLKEEKARGISIDLGFAYLPVPGGGRLGFVDVPGHERFVQTMLAGAGGIDWALLVVAADDGPMPQTREHLAILDLLGIGRGLVALTKSDLAGPERLAQVEAEIRGLLAPTSLAGLDILPVSTRTGEGVDALRETLFAAARRHQGRAADRLFRLAVDRSFVLPGAGTVVTGTVLSGSVAVGERVVVGPSGLPARVRAIHAQNEAATRGGTGERCALNLAGDGVGKDAIRRGDMVCDPALHAPSARIDAEFRLLASERKAVETWMPVRLHHAATNVAGRLVPLSATRIAPGESGLVQIVLDEAIAATVGDRFVLRDTSAQRTLGGGRFLDLRAPARKRRTPERLAALTAAGRGEGAAALGPLLDGPSAWLDLAAFARDRALPFETARGHAEALSLATLTVADATLAFPASTWDRMRRSLSFRLAEFHAENPDLMGLGQERVRLAMEPRLPAPAFRAFLQRLAAEGEIALEGAWVRLASHSVTLSAGDERRWASIAPLLGGGERFKPPRVRDIAGATGVPEPEIRKLMKLAGRLGRVDEVAHDHFFLRATVSEMVDIVAALSQTSPAREFTASQFRDRVENGRKVAIQILEFFDRHGLTLRRGDLRRVNPHRLDLFRPLPGSGEGHAASGGEASPVGRPDFKSG